MIKNWNARYSDNIKDFEGYPIGKSLKYLKNPEIISLAGGLPSPDVFQRSGVRIATEKILKEDGNLNKVMQYSAIPGEQGLVNAVLDFLKRDNINIDAKNLLITTSGQLGLDLTGRLFLNKDDIVLVDRPTFAGAIVAFQMERPQIVGVDIQEDGSDVDGFRSKVLELEKEGKKPKFIYVVPDFQNPTGITMSLEKREALLDLSYEFDIPIVEDSPYRDLRYYGETIPAIFSLDQKREGGNVIGLYTFSKLFCPGMRVGFNIGNESVIEKMTAIKEGNILNTPKMNQDICQAFLEEMNYLGHIEKCNIYYRDKLEVFLKTMDETFPPETGVSWTKPDGGLFLWVTLPKHIDTEKLFFEAIKYKVAFVPGWQFYGENPSNNHMRINFSFASKENLIEAVRRLAECIKAQ
ncbi:PLP-dependent aminotransferase family protein [bacterium]|nr:PLP-dependent aminotransferase family protein [bacterium]